MAWVLVFLQGAVFVFVTLLLLFYSGQLAL